jgi:outer membrane lipoprotein SlyB
MKTTACVIAISAALLGASACTPTQNASTFHSQEAMRAQPVAFGEVVAVRGVDIRPGQTRVGTVTGALLGGLGGSQIGGGSVANAAGAVGGAVLGGMAGSAIQGSRTTAGVEITIELDDGQTVAIVQPGDPRDFRVGDRVRVTGTADNARVTR